jgi:hypothetical protein
MLKERSRYGSCGLRDLTAAYLMEARESLGIDGAKEPKWRLPEGVASMLQRAGSGRRTALHRPGARRPRRMGQPEGWPLGSSLARSAFRAQFEPSTSEALQNVLTALRPNASQDD